MACHVVGAMGAEMDETGTRAVVECRLDGAWVEAAEIGGEDDAAEDLDAGHLPVDQLGCAVADAERMIVKDERLHACRFCLLGDLEGRKPAGAGF